MKSVSFFRRLGRRNEGYGLVVVAALFTAFAMIAAAYLDRSSATLDLNQQEQARAQMTRLTVALAKYARYHSDRFPCPASDQVLVTNSSFGDVAAATCHTGAEPAGTYFLTGTTNANKLIYGMVPVKALVPYGISYDDAFDPWGSRIVYVVHRDLASGGTAAIVAGDRPAVSDYVSGEVVSPAGDMLLLSFGRDRIGGKLRGQTASLASPAIACPGGTDRYRENCDGDRDFLIGPLFMAAQASAATYFDDFVSVYYYSGV